MADFIPAFEAALRNEGGFQLTTTAGDRGGMTYAGISRRSFPGWSGWGAVDRGAQPAPEAVRSHYWANFWAPLHLNEVQDQAVARSLFDFGINAGAKTSTRLAQAVLGVTPDGVLGPKTLAALNAMPPAQFLPLFALAKIARYRDIVARDRSQLKFLVGWINRTLTEASA